jgi:hypothetical protein
MGATNIALIVLFFAFGGSILGLWLRTKLPDYHITVESKEAIKLALGLVASMTALVIGLMVAAAKDNFDSQELAMRQSVTQVLMLDRMLANYGPETEEIRASMKDMVAARIADVSSKKHPSVKTLDISGSVSRTERILFKIQALSPKTEAQQWFRSQAVEYMSGIMQTRWAILERIGNSIPIAFLIILICWFTFIFISFGLISSRNVTILAVFFVCALSVSTAIFLILEMDSPFGGIIKVSAAPLRFAVSYLGQ